MAGTFIYPKFRQAMLDWTNAGVSAAPQLLHDTIQAQLVTTAYVPAAAHQTTTSLTGTTGSATTLAATLSLTAGSTFPWPETFTSSGTTAITTTLAPSTSYNVVLIDQTITAGGNPVLIAFSDGQTLATCTITGTTQTVLVCSPLATGVSSGATLTRVSGTGAATLTTTGTASPGADSIAISSATLVAGDVYAVPRTPLLTAGFVQVGGSGATSATITADSTFGLFAI